MKKIILCAICVALLFTACGSTKETENASEQNADIQIEQKQASGTEITFTDDRGTSFTVERPQRVAALIGSFADCWCLAGGKDVLVAAANDTWTSFDLGLDDSVANLGAITAPNLEVLLAAEPDFVIGSTNTSADLELKDTLEAAGITAAYFDVQNFEDYLRVLKVFTQLTGQEENYELYGTEVKAQVDAAIARQTGEAFTVLCLRATGSSCKVKASEDNILGEMLADLGCINVADSDSSLLENLSIEAIIQANPDYIFAVLQGSDSTDAQAMLEKTLLDNPAWSELRAVKEGRFYTVENSLYNLKPNARWGEAYEKLADILYPEE